MSEPENTPTAWAERGSQFYLSRDYQAAAQAFARAAAAFAHAEDNVKAAEMANNQAVALLQVDDARRALKVLAGTPGIFKEAGEVRLAAQAHGNLGQAFAEDGQVDRAQDHLRSAMQLFERIDDHEGLQHTAKALSRLQLNQGDAMGALFSMQQGLEQGSSNSTRDRLLRWLLNLPARFLSR